MVNIRSCTFRCECKNDVQNTQLNANPSPKIATNNYEECEEKTLTVTSVQKLLCSHETNTCNDYLNSDEVSLTNDNKMYNIPDV